MLAFTLLFIMVGSNGSNTVNGDSCDGFKVYVCILDSYAISCF